MDKIKMILIILCVGLTVALIITINSKPLTIKDERDQKKIKELEQIIKTERKNREENYISIDKYNELRVKNDSLGKELKRRERKPEDIYDDVSDNVDNSDWDIKKRILTDRGYTVKGTGN